MSHQADIRTLLVADDDPLFRRGLRQLVEQVDNMTLIAEAEDGQTAVDLARQTKPHIILMDYQMPKMNGATASKIILDEQPHITLVGVSAFMNARTINALQSAGVRMLFRKSEGPERLIELLKTL